MNAAQAIEPFYFRQSSKALFGCLHRPASALQRNCGVLICQPMGHEYVNSHRALRQLASRLSERGFPVLRFDYYGTGDSYGSCTEGRIAQWLEDISSAIEELKRLTGCSEICLVGLRLGAVLASISSVRRDDVGGLVLWDPVENGKQHLRELLLVNDEMSRLHPKQHKGESLEFLDLVGFRFSRACISELEQIHLPPIRQIPAKKVLVIRSDESLSEDLRGQAMEPRRLKEWSIPAPPIWEPNPEGTLLVPARLLQAIVAWSCGAYS